MRQILIELAVLGVIGIVLALIGPFGSFEASFGARLAYWVPLALAGYAIYRPIGAVADWIATRLALPAAPMWIAATLIATVPMTMLVWAASCAGRCRHPSSIDAALTWYGQVLVIGGAVTLLLYIRGKGEAAASVDAPPSPASFAPPAAPPPNARFLKRLSPHLGVDLVALEMEDHYVRAHTLAGSELILMRLRDAIDELDGIDGSRVHRSWWVVRSAVRTVRREGRSVRLVLTNDVEAPVSRERVAALRAAGWL
ncbi:LytTR family DNA-binding domain-containing protein [Sphingomonas sp.]|uniref:LytTR family DNA-binding domain-containing protein n=1 Tax=Sphingomonas sp. TaxID=28214 RepID=UPI00307CE769